MDVIVNASLSHIFLIWPPVAANIIYFLFHAIDGFFWGGAIVETLEGGEILCGLPPV